ncbi:aminodeoxychorismate lyase [Cohnella candidum]|uniref:4-amino-4-deoxychorismate lyase n=1 Tax=Cohnella candidum TaxID=2674991 RepID=A0A3G3K399_9BACL|nr:aminodeoxychorismate lyase [Cohnella candidum]AYQ74641.1 4-amino-4-deoxychorismate lyase [Cohnella candidum]
MNVLRNGRIIDSKEAVISAFDHGFLYGMGLFETFRTYDGQPWLLERHAARLADSCRLLGISYEPDAERMREGVARLLAASGLEDAYIRWSVSAGEGAVGLPTGPYETPTEIVYAKELAPDRPDNRSAKTLRLLHLRRSSTEGEIRLKSFHYMNNILAKRELAEGGAGPGAEGLFLDAAGNVCEGIVSNVFWLSDGVLHTPSTAAGPLPGITREYLMELAASSGYPVKEGLYPFEDLLRADEVFLTNSIQEIVPVTTLEDDRGLTVSRYASAEANSVTRQWMERYRRAAEGSLER